MNIYDLSHQSVHPATAAGTSSQQGKGVLVLYATVLLLLAFQAVYTVYHGGLVVGNGFRLAQLEKQKAELAAEQTQLQQNLAQQHSLLQIQNSELYKQFQPMANVVTVTDTQTVASR